MRNALLRPIPGNWEIALMASSRCLEEYGVIRKFQINTNLFTFCHTSMATGFSRRSLKVCRNLAPVAPSMTL